VPGNEHLAEVNVARLREPIRSPVMAGFVRALDDVNWLAEQSPGFVWRHRPEWEPLTYGALGGVEVVVTLSVWVDFESLRRFVYRSAHGLFMRQRARWFEPLGGFTTALWWVPEGSRPSVDEGLARLDHLRAHGPTPGAFSLRRQFEPTAP
jgi:hypothetical protein